MNTDADDDESTRGPIPATGRYAGCRWGLGGGEEEIAALPLAGTGVREDGMRPRNTAARRIRGRRRSEIPFASSANRLL